MGSVDVRNVILERRELKNSKTKANVPPHDHKQSSKVNYHVAEKKHVNPSHRKNALASRQAGLNLAWEQRGCYFLKGCRN